MRARDVMTSPVIVLRRDTPAREAAALLCAHGFTSAPVVDAGRVVGVATEAERRVDDGRGAVAVERRREQLERRVQQDGDVERSGGAVPGDLVAVHPDTHPCSAPGTGEV